jgi:hypothetical protein
VPTSTPDFEIRTDFHGKSKWRCRSGPDRGAAPSRLPGWPPQAQPRPLPTRQHSVEGYLLLMFDCCSAGSAATRSARQGDSSFWIPHFPNLQLPLNSNLVTRVIYRPAPSGTITRSNTSPSTYLRLACRSPSRADSDCLYMNMLELPRASGRKTRRRASPVEPRPLIR